MLRRLLVVALALLALGACRVDTSVELTVEPDGSGELLVEAFADKELVDRAPGLIDDLRVDDLAAAGWSVTGPEVTGAGGLHVELVHSFATVAEAEALLNSLNGPGGPLVGVTLTRTSTSTRSEVLLNGTLRVTGGLDAFADSEMVAALGATPYADELAAGSYTLADVVGVQMTAHLPGDITSAAGDKDGNSVTWAAPLDGTAQAIQMSAVRSRDDGRWWRLGANAALVALVLWIVVAGAFLAYVSVARRRAMRRLGERRAV